MQLVAWTTRFILRRFWRSDLFTVLLLLVALSLLPSILEYIYFLTDLLAYLLKCLFASNPPGTLDNANSRVSDWHPNLLKLGVGPDKHRLQVRQASTDCRPDTQTQTFISEVGIRWSV